MSKPKPNGTPPNNGNGRSTAGRFLPGNKFGKGGNVHASRVKELQAVLFDATEPKDIEEVWEKLLELAKEGNIKAAQIVLDRLLGKAKETVEIGGEAVDLVSSVRDGLLRLLARPDVANALEDEVLRR